MLTSENQAARSRLGADVDHKVVRRQARPGWVLIDFAELWQYRELSVFYAFRDINPPAPTHVLVIPRKHITTVADATAEDTELLGHMMIKANEIAQSEGLKENGYRYVINCGEWGGQLVMHLHLHILGGRQMTWPPG